MQDFIIENELELVIDRKTRDYLKEVVSDYSIGNYRSAIVVLYTVLIFDLISKLKTLEEIYSDSTAKDILDKIKKEQQDNPRNPLWEKLLINEIVERTELLSQIDLMKINHLIDDRNVCAHPAYNNNFELINPNAESVRYHLRNMLEISFKKEALLGKKITTEFIINIADFYSKQGLKGFEEYIKIRYLKRINNSIKKELFKFLWKLVFILDEPDCITNRTINTKALLMLTQENESLFIEQVKDNPSYYNNITPTNFSCKFYSKLTASMVSRLISLIVFISYFPKFYTLLDASCKKNIEIESQKNINLIIFSFFQSQDITKHIELIESHHESIYIESNGWVNTDRYSCFDPRALFRFYEFAKERESGDLVITFLINYFGDSVNWSGSTEIYNDVIIKLLPELSKEQFEILLIKMNKNSQIYRNREICSILDDLKISAKEKYGHDYDFSEYKNLWP